MAGPKVEPGVSPATTTDWSSTYPTVKTPQPTSTPGETIDSIAQQVSEHTVHLKWILSRCNIMDKTTAALRLSNQETEQYVDTVLESTEKFSAHFTELAKSNESLESESKSLHVSIARLKTDLQKQESLHITVKADFNKLLEIAIQGVKTQYDSQLEEAKLQHDAQQSRSEALTDEISVIRDQNRALTTLLGDLVMHLEVQNANERQHTLQDHGLGQM